MASAQPLRPVRLATPRDDGQQDNGVALTVRTHG
jgi:hypothetical protein